MVLPDRGSTMNKLENELSFRRSPSLLNLPMALPEDVALTNGDHIRQAFGVRRECLSDGRRAPSFASD